MIPKNVNPEFDQMFDFHGMLPENIRKQTLVLKVFHRRSSKHSLLGVCECVCVCMCVCECVCVCE